VGKLKYPWHTLEKVGDVFILDTDVLNLRQAAKVWGRTNGIRIKVPKVVRCCS